MSSSCANPVANGSSSCVLSVSNPGTCENRTGRIRASPSWQQPTSCRCPSRSGTKLSGSTALGQLSNVTLSRVGTERRSLAPPPRGVGRPPTDVRSSNSRGVVGPHVHASAGPTGRGAVARFLYYDIAATPRLAVSGTQRLERRGNGLYSSFL